jgi:hypothetical protein
MEKIKVIVVKLVAWNYFMKIVLVKDVELKI